MKASPKPKPLDLLIAGLIALLSLLALLPFLPTQTGTLVRVEQRGELLYEGPLDVGKVVAADGATVIIADGTAHIIDADCQNKLCMQGIATTLHPLYCVPNQLIVRIISQGEEAPDGVSY